MTVSIRVKFGFFKSSIKELVFTTAVVFTTFAATAYATVLPADISKLISEYSKLNELCRGGSGDSPLTISACERREKKSALIEKAGWCLGSDDQPGYKKRWMKCESHQAQGLAIPIRKKIPDVITIEPAGAHVPPESQPKELLQLVKPSALEQQKSRPEIRPIDQPNTLNYDPDERRNAAMFNQLIAEAKICMRDGSKAMLMQGARNRSQIVSFTIPTCGSYVQEFLITTSGRPEREATAFVQAMAEQELNKAAGIR